MASPDKIIQEVTRLVEESAEKFNNRLPALEKRVLGEITLILKGLDVKGDKISATVKNIRLIGDITRKLKKIILNKEFKDQVKEYVKSFNTITSLQNQYFKVVESKFKPTALLQAIREQAIDSTLDGLTEVGLNAVAGKVKGVLQQNITTGGSYKALIGGLNNTIVGTPGGEGIVSSQLKTFTITAVAQYSRQYSQTVAQGLNFRWYQYVGSTITTTRCFCHAMVEKRYFHVSEVPALLKGDFEEFEEKECEINGKTKLPDGMISGTNVSNFFTLAGGWNCQHSIFPVPDSLVPKELKDKFKDTV